MILKIPCVFNFIINRDRQSTVINMDLCVFNIQIYSGTNQLLLHHFWKR